MSEAIGIGLVGFGWMGHAHTRAYRNLPLYFPDEGIRPRLVAVSDTIEDRLRQAREVFGYEEGFASWWDVIEHPDVEVVDITAPNALHEEVAVAAAAAGKHVICEKPVGFSPEATARIEHAARTAGVNTGCGFNYRWAPLVQHTKALLEQGRMGEITRYHGRFFAMYGRDRLGLLSWRFLQEEAGYGVLLDLMSHVIDMANHLAGRVRRLVAVKDIFVRERPLPRPDAGTHYDRGGPTDPTGEVTNEDYVGAIVEFESGARGILEADRTMMGPQSDMGFDLHASRGAARWSLEDLNRMDLYLPEESPADGYVRVLAGDAFPHHGRFVPGTGNPIGWEDLKVIEALEFLKSMRDGRPHAPGFGDALAVADVQAAMVRSWETGGWVDVASLRID